MTTRLCYGCMEPISSDDLTCEMCGYKDSDVSEDFALQPGFLLENRYIIGKTIGIGGFGITYLAMDTRINVKVAIKEFYIKKICQRNAHNVVIDDSGKNKKIFKTYKDKFIDEAKMLADYNMNDGVVTVSNYFAENDTAYIVMEFLEGMTLEEHLKQYGEYITFKDAFEALQPIMIALKEIHKKGVIHRDISPDNIFITQEGEVKLLDFGAARVHNVDNDRQLSVVLKHGYAPIEQYSKKGKQGPYTDIYALGATIYRMLEGKKLLESAERMSAGEEILSFFENMKTSFSKKERKIFYKMLAIEHKDRYQTINDLFQSYGISNKIKGQKNSRRKRIKNLDPLTRKIIIGVIYSLTVVTIGVLGVVYAFDKVPNYVEEKYDTIESNISLHKSKWSVEYEYNDEFDKGIVFFQSDAGKFIPRWKDQSLKVSLGSTKKIDFEDSNLNIVVSGLLDKSPGNIFLGDLIDIRSLDLSSKKIKSLNGIEHFKNLESINISSNLVEDMRPLYSLDKLKILNVYDNKIRALNGIEELENLESLTVANNYIGNINPIMSLKNLTEFNGINNDILNIDGLEKLENLKYLYMSENKITSVDTLAHMKSIKVILLSDNEIYDISSLSDMSTVTYLNISNNEFDLNRSRQIIDQLQKKGVKVVY